jgi:uncharacterized membrane protein HdeD (DUF308 family)
LDSRDNALVRLIAGIGMIYAGLFLMFANPHSHVSTDIFFQILGVLLFLFGIALIISFKDVKIWLRRRYEDEGESPSKDQYQNLEMTRP